MLRAVEGLFRDGRIELQEIPGTQLDLFTDR
jgi:hypothetical protein